MDTILCLHVEFEYATSRGINKLKKSSTIRSRENCSRDHFCFLLRLIVSRSWSLRNQVANSRLKSQDWRLEVEVVESQEDKVATISHDQSIQRLRSGQGSIANRSGFGELFTLNIATSSLDVSSRPAVPKESRKSEMMACCPT
eukprot:scaffold484121_cov19-Prasinocladus_malaysianus.AAC.1